MSEWLIKTFVKDYQNVKNSKVRETYGTLSSVVGLVCNIALFIVKFIMGTISNSISVISDAFNNLSDCLSCVVTLVSYKLAAQPADKDHPFGHGRIEYLSSLVIASLILLVGVEFLRTSFDKLLHPEPVIFKPIIVISLIVSVLVKLWMSAFNRYLGNKVNSSVMLATSTDSLSDAITTSVTIISVVASLFTDLPVDAVIGLVVSVMILKAGYEIIKDTVDTLIGKPADRETVDEMMAIVQKYHVVLGVHDLIVHNYGPGKMIASFHAEVSCHEDILKAHDQIDLIEKEIYEQLHIMTVIHMDPIETDNEALNELKVYCQKLLQEINMDLSLHDFRMVCGESHTNLIFDVLVPYTVKINHAEIKKQLDDKLHQEYPNYYTVITFDASFFE